MKLEEIFTEELNSEGTKYFILDSGKHERDVDFETYEWKTSINNKISAGDLFIYRKSKSLSPRNEFMFLGVGKVGQITGSDDVVAKIEKPHPFSDPIFQSEINSYKWKWKDRRGEGWEHFWNQYGINQIPKEDFLHILQIAEGDYDPEYDSELVHNELEIADEDFSVDDTKAFAASRPWQGAWSRKVKDAYGYQCAICGLNSPKFLVGSHIIPVRDRDYMSIRKDPSNGICLCVIHDKAFDAGYITITNESIIKLSESAKEDSVLWNYLIPFNGGSVKKPIKYIPKGEYLEYHQNNIFLG